MNAERFECALSFIGIPYGHALSASRAAVVGIPLDVGTDAHRVGARRGPQAIRIRSGRPGAHFPPRGDVDVTAAVARHLRQQRA